MATPSSSATSPSPTMTFSPPLHLPAPSPDLPDQDHRKRAVEKFKARAEISNVTRSLRARLSYASYKATHNVANAQTQNQALIFSRTMAAKRKASAAPTPYSNSGGASNSPGGSGMRRPGMGVMAPPQNAGPRTYYPAAPNAAAGGSADAARHMPAQSLFTSILAPPPSQQARTILNVADPPIQPPSRPPASPRPRASGKLSSRSIAEGTRAMAKTRRDDKPERRKAKRSVDKGKQRQRTSSGRHAAVDADGDVDMKAAATLTSLLLNHRPSIGSASSPRSSLDDDEAAQSYAQQFAQSSARHGHAAGAPPNASGASTSAAGLPAFRRASATPPPTQPGSQASSQGHGQGQTTPRPAPTDNEAADLMLFLATSPSPVRKGSDLAAYRALNGGGLGAGDSFTSSVSSIGGEMRGGGSRTSTPAPPAPFVPTQLLPPPPLPVTMPPLSTMPMTTSSNAPSPTPAPMPMPVPTPASASPKPVYGQPIPQPPQSQPQPQQPTPVQPQAQTQAQAPAQGGLAPPAAGDFNFSDFLNASPRAGTPTQSTHPAAPSQTQMQAAQSQAQMQQAQQQQMQQQQQQKTGGLRADVGRKLFEEEQMRHHAHGKELGAGIDLVQQS
ncbi:hypothetical protein C8R46DRAFT_1178061 [Mycena filopes]|nr:hypothetical protein C8R46DRAFT_1178061 [Mycena filopes]